MCMCICLCLIDKYPMCFNFCGVYISRLHVFKFAGAGYSGVEIFADVFRHVVLVPVGVPMLAQAVFPRIYHPLSFFGWPIQRNTSSALLLCSHSTLSLALSLNDARLLQCHFSGIHGDLGSLSLCDGLVILAPFYRPLGHRSALYSCSHARSDLGFFLYSFRH